MATNDSNKGKRNFIMLIYPDSMPEDAVGMLLDEKVCIAVSPLHQPDPKGPEEERKPHHHVLISYSGPRKIEDVEKYFRPKYHGTHIFICKDRNVYTRYMVHLDNPDKQKFEPKELMANYDARPYLAKEVYTIDIVKEIRRRAIRDFTQLVDIYVEEERFAEIEKIASKAAFFNKYLDRFFTGKEK